MEDKGEINRWAALFSIMVMMAIVTTLMASPVFELVYRKKPTLAAEGDTAPANA